MNNSNINKNSCIKNESHIKDDQKELSTSPSIIKAMKTHSIKDEEKTSPPPPLLNKNKFTHPSKMYSPMPFYNATISNVIVPPVLPLPFTPNTLKIESSYQLPPPPSVAHKPPPLVSKSNALEPLPPPLMSNFISHHPFMNHPPPPFPMMSMDGNFNNTLPPPILPPHLLPHSIPPAIYGRFPVQFNGHNFPLPPPPLPGMNNAGFQAPVDPNGFMSIEYRCEFCGYLFNTKQKLSMHKRITHGQPIAGRKIKRTKVSKGGMRYFCQYCKRGFSAKQHFDYHVRTHTGEKPFKCVQCGKAFRAKHSLKNHMRIHSGERPYQCKLCGKFFRQLGVMKNHIKSVHENH